VSGHSKWANIKRQKAVVDAKRAVVYAKMSREIIVAAKMGGGDPAANFRLRTAIERAKAEGVPNDNIARAIEKGSGSGAADQIEELTYEGYGPGGVAIMVKCATDNRNRTAGDVRSYFSKYGGNMGETGCVGWMFKERGEVTIERSPKLSEDDVLMVAVDAGADDLDYDQEEVITVVCQGDKLEGVKGALQAKGYKVSSAEVVMAPLSVVEITDSEAAKQLLRLLDTLENHDDVQHVYANFDMDANWLNEFLS
jgi:YebC/PmpR family DNA-binding regulatory protein